MFDPVDPKQRLPEMEEGILQYWKEEDVFKRSVRKRGLGSDDTLDNPGDEISNKRSNELTFSFYDGPPFATGLPHYGHLLAGTIKDVIPRFQTMRGKMVQRRFGWDCHGLPIENLIEKEHDIKDKQQIEEMGIGAFNDLCRSSVQRYTDEWRKTVERMGRWVDMDWDYKTMDPEYMESIWWVFSQLHSKDLIYEGRKSMHVCPRCVTPLSNFEVTLGYKDVTDWTSYTTYPLVDEPDTALIAWTTTTWTLPGNLFLAVGKKIEYVKVKVTDNPNIRISEYPDTFIVAKDLVENVFKDLDYDIVETLKAKDLIGKKYVPLFPYFVEEYKDQNAFRIVEGDFVTTEDGTGIVHIAPGFGTDDYELGKREGVDVLSHVGMDGKMVDAVTDFAGLDVKPIDDPTKTDKKITEKLKEMGRLFKAESFKHSYPHCWRCDSPLINYSTSSWFVAIDKIKDKMLKANSRTEWVPSHIRDGRFGKWLENARDWAISRNRYWGTPLPIWRSGRMENGKWKMENDGDVDVIGSRDELMQRKLIRFTKITALRHAESEGNLIPIYQGEEPGTDLTERGKKQAEHVGEFLATNPQPLTTIYCSPLARTKQTAEAIAKKTGAEVVVDERLREVRFGDYEGKTVDFSDLTFIKERRAHKIEKNKPESIYHFDGMEPWESVYARVSEFLDEVIPKHRSEHIVVVTHADPMVNIEHFFTKEDPVKLSHRPYPEKATPKTYFWDHDRSEQMDLHKDRIDDITWQGPTSDASVELTLVRHGETDINKEERAQGHADIPLNETGKKQAKEQAKNLKGKDIDVIISSDLGRAVETAQIIAKEIGATYEEKWPELRERNNGTWDLQKVADIAKEAPGVDGYMGTNFHHLTAPDGESLSQFLQRVEGALLRIAREYAGKKVMVVSHGGTTRAILTAINNLQYKTAAFTHVQNAQAIDITLDQPMVRIPDVLDCWFESGSMPYAQEHFPFEMNHALSPSPSPVGGRGEQLPPSFPADFIAEGVDQTRGWFYTLTVLGAALFETSPFEHCVVNGTVLAEDGKKMSKRLKNYPDPLEVVDRHGADAVRFTLMSSPAVRGEDLRFSEKLVEETLRNVLLPLWNTYSFFVTYANAAGFEPVDSRRKSEHPLDVWIQAEVQDLVNRMTKELDNYDLSATCNQLHETIDALTNWYVRLSRRRFAGKGVLDSYPDSDLELTNKRSNEFPDQHDALTTLYDVLLTLSQLLAPFCPYITDAIYLNLVAEDHGSIHLTDWPEVRELSNDDQKLIEKNRVMRQIVSLGNSIRASQKIKVRQPLSKATYAVRMGTFDRSMFTKEDLDLLRQELNVHNISYESDPGKIAKTIAKVNARAVGPKLGPRVQEIIQAGKNGIFKTGEIIETGKGIIRVLDVDLVYPDEVILEYQGKEGEAVAGNKGVVVSLDTDVTDALRLEGEARDFIRGVQRVRKESGLAFTDEITLQVEGCDDVLAAHKELIESETRSEIGQGLGLGLGQGHEIDVGERKVKISFTKN